MIRVPAGLRGRLAIVLAVAIVPALAVLTVERINQSRQQRADVRQQALSLARLAAQAQQRRMEAARQLLIALARSSELQDPASCTRFVRGLAAEYIGIYTEIGWADMSGKVVCHVLEGRPDVSVADRTYFQRVVKTGSFAAGDLMYGRITGAPALAFAHPIRNAAGVMTGVAFASVDLRVLSDSMKGDVKGEGVSVSLVDRQGAVLARSADAGRYIGIRGTAEQVRTMARIGELATEFPGPDSIVRVYGVVTIRENSGEPIFFVAVGLPQAPLVAAAQRRLFADLLVVAVLGLGVLTACWLGSNYLIRRPIQQLLETTASIASGHLEARVTEAGGVRELDALGKALNDMAGKLQQRDVHLRRGQRLEAIGQLAGGIAHDFNNLLTVILGYGESLRQYVKPDSPAAEELQQLRVAAERAAKLTQQLLAFSRQQVLQPKALNINDVIAQMKSLVTRTIGDDIILTTLSASDLGIVLADQAQLEQVILNLVINARDAMPEGGTITVQTANVEITPANTPALADNVVMTLGSYVTLSVRDTGVGMDEETRLRIFEPFFTTKGHRGTGLGLATVYGIVKQSGGFILCDSEPGRGTCITIYLPKTNEQPATVEPKRAVAPPPGSETVLVVEDEEAVRSFISNVLTRAGYHVDLARDGREALDRLRSTAVVDLLITDVKMPGLNGHTLYDRARSLRPRLPVVFISGYARDVLAAELSLSDEAAFVQKPFMPNELLARVRQTLDGTTN